MPPEDQGMHFENQGQEFGTPPQRSAGLDLANKLVEWKLVSTVQEAQYALIGVVVIVLLIAGFLFFHSGSSVPPPPPVSQASQ